MTCFTFAFESFTLYLVPLTMHSLASHMLCIFRLPPHSHLARARLPHLYVPTLFLLCVLAVLYHRLSLTVTKPQFALVFVLFARA